MIKIYADGADLKTMTAMAQDERIDGFTTNPSLARKAGVGNYLEFCGQALRAAGSKPVSLEVLADEPSEMLRQGRLLSGLAHNAVVKIPVVNSHGELTLEIIGDLARAGVSLNVTAVFTRYQVAAVAGVLRSSQSEHPPIVSLFAGRVADAGVDPLKHVRSCCMLLEEVCPHAEMLWASPRQLYDMLLAERAGCGIITMTSDLIGKLHLIGKDLKEYSRETSEMFHRDAQAAGFVL